MIYESFSHLILELGTIDVDYGLVFQSLIRPAKNRLTTISRMSNFARACAGLLATQFGSEGRDERGGMTTCNKTSVCE